MTSLEFDRKVKASLLYFKTQGHKYRLAELKRLLGVKDKDFDSIIHYLLKWHFIKYNHYELEITTKGKHYLKS